MKMVLAVLLALSMFVSVSTALADETMYIVGYPDTFLRRNPSTENPYLARMPYGSAVNVIDEGSTWALICYNGQYGYCMREFLNEDDPYYLMEPHPESAEQAFGTNMLRHGNRTPNIFVMNLQLCLVQGGYLDADPGADGYFGRETKAALAEFQKEHDLYASGEAGDITKAVLWDEYADLLMQIGHKR